MSTHRRTAAVRFLVPACLFSLLAFAPGAHSNPLAEPVIDGDLRDMIVFAEALYPNGSGCGLDLPDPETDVAVLDPEFAPCSPMQGQYFTNGFDLSRVVVALQGQNLFLGLRTAGVIGDADGDGNPDQTCGTTGIQDAPGIGPGDRYTWFLDTNCSDRFSPDVTVWVSGNALHVAGLTFDAATYRYHGTDIEVKLTNIHLPPGALMSGLTARAAVSSDSDGLSEDSSPVLPGPPLTTEVELATDVNPQKFCRGGVLTVSIGVGNPGMAPLDIVRVRDALPPGFTYVRGSAHGIGEPVIEANGELCFPDVALNPGEMRPVRFRMKAGGGCSGNSANRAMVAGRSTRVCRLPPGFEVVRAQETPITCRSAPCQAASASSDADSIDSASSDSDSDAFSGTLAPDASAALFQTRNYPNPVLGGSTSIYYTVPGYADRSGVEIAIFDAGGRLVRRISLGEQAPGAHTAAWDLADESGQTVGSGIYFYSVRVGGEKLTRKLVIVRR